MFKIVTDSAWDRPIEMANELGVTVVPFYVSFDDKNYLKEHVDIEVDEFYKTMVETRCFAKTSLPSIQDYVDTFKPMAEEGYDILCYTISKKLSGSFNSANIASQIVMDEYPDRNIKVFYSTLVTLSQGDWIIMAANMALNGSTMEEIINVQDLCLPTSRIFFSVDNLDYLIHGGRVGKAMGKSANLLGLKPIIVVKDGELFSEGVVRGKKASYRKCIDKLIEYIKETTNSPSSYVFSATSAYDVEDRNILKEMLKEALRENWPDFDEEISTCQIGCTIGVHTGPTAFGVSAIRKVSD